MRDLKYPFSGPTKLPGVDVRRIFWGYLSGDPVIFDPVMTYTPLDEASLWLYLNPTETDSLTLDGTKAIQIDDLSGNGRHFYAGSSNAPDSGQDTFNSLNTLTFDHTNTEKLSRSSMSLPVDGVWFATHVCSITSFEDQYSSIFSAKDQDGTAADFQVQSNNSSYFDYYLNHEMGDNIYSSNLDGYSDGELYIFTVVWDHNIEVVTVYANGHLVGQVEMSGIPDDVLDYNLMTNRAATSSVSGLFAGHVICTNVYARERVEGYFAWLYGIQDRLPMLPPIDHRIALTDGTLFTLSDATGVTLSDPAYDRYQVKDHPYKSIPPLSPTEHQVMLADGNLVTLVDSTGVSLANPAYDVYRGPLNNASDDVTRAHALFLLDFNYTGPLIRVRRTLDGEEINVGSDSSGDIDQEFLLHFARGGQDITVKYWYDQSQSDDIKAATIEDQPTIVSNGSMIKDGDKPALYFNGLNQLIADNPSQISYPIFTAITVANIFDTLPGPRVMGQWNELADPEEDRIWVMGLRPSEDQVRFSVNNDNNILYNSAITVNANQQQIYRGVFDHSSATLYMQAGTVSTTEPFSGPEPTYSAKFTIGRLENSSFGDMEGYVQCAILTTQDMIKEDTDIVYSRLNDYFQTYET